MTREEFISYVGKNILVDFPFHGELQKWSMKNFTYDKKTDIIQHNRLPLIIDVFIRNARNPHIPLEKEKATHG